MSYEHQNILSFEEAFCTEETDFSTGEYDLDRSEYVDEIRKQSIVCMEDFFCKKSYWCGGRIPKNRLLSERNIEAVMKADIIDAIDVIYSLIDQKDSIENFNCGSKIWRIKLVNGALNRCARMLIPKCFAGGMLLVMMEMCHNVKAVATLDKYNKIREEMANNQKRKVA